MERDNKMWEGDVSMCVVGVFTDEYDILSYKMFSYSWAHESAELRVK